MKSSAIIRIILFSIIVIVLLGILFSGLGMHFYSFKRATVESTTETILESTLFPADQIKNLEINWVAGTITIEALDSTDVICVTETNSDPKHPMVCKTDGSKLIIQDREDNHNASVFSSAERKELYIAVPEKWICNNLVINSAAAAPTLRNMTIEEVTVNGASGSCDVQDCSIEDLSINSAAGDLFFTGCIMNLDIDGASTSAVVNAKNIPQSISMDSMSGKLDLTLPEDCGFQLDQDSLSGKSNIDFDTRTVDGTQIAGDGACKISVNGLSASVSIHKSNQASVACSDAK